MSLFDRQTRGEPVAYKSCGLRPKLAALPIKRKASGARQPLASVRIIWPSIKRSRQTPSPRRRRNDENRERSGREGALGGGDLGARDAAVGEPDAGDVVAILDIRSAVQIIWVLIYATSTPSRSPLIHASRVLQAPSSIFYLLCLELGRLARPSYAVAPGVRSEATTARRSDAGIPDPRRRRIQWGRVRDVAPPPVAEVHGPERRRRPRATVVRGLHPK